jgi:hypothetical protein
LRVGTAGSDFSLMSCLCREAVEREEGALVLDFHHCWFDFHHCCSLAVDHEKISLAPSGSVSLSIKWARVGIGAKIQ